MVAIAIGLVEIAVILVVGALPALCIWGIVSAATFDEATWSRAGAGNSKVMWIVIQLVLGFVGSIAYLVAMRPKLKAAEHAGPPAY